MKTIDRKNLCFYVNRTSNKIHAIYATFADSQSDNYPSVSVTHFRLKSRLVNKQGLPQGTICQVCPAPAQLLISSISLMDWLDYQRSNEIKNLFIS